MEKRRRIGAYGLAYDERGRVLLVRSSIRSNTPGTWYLPGGGIDHGEDPRVGVVREFMEETGLVVEISGLRDVSSDVVEFPWRGVLLHHDRVIFDVVVTGGELTTETDGSSDLPEWVDPADLSSLDLVPFAARLLGLGDGAVPVPETPENPVGDDSGETDLSGRPPSDATSNKIKRFGAYGVVTDPDNRILLSLIAAGYPGAGLWHLPGGGVDFGEQPAEGLVREVFEESGQRGVVADLIDVSFFHDPAAVGPEGVPLDWYSVRALYRVAVAEPAPTRVTEATGGSTEQARWFTPAEVAGLTLTDFALSALRHL
ncbi:ADP-ribose pyrophosphatase YjhB (NUDIX family) [Allocatelliglobosispora scoriae]|uniref:ADP-ribose pyrophosphatase YjhB (NUDIX family) n=1 Tax=Allocatelliglobosispora scoriae TaxID=643052 RepID=A0A841BXW3_9ACTN|nr:NUDIX domain-containing protein [Allocatelliglobosispora scoriae]MBB5871560.1 ADP-ribose pyrophosphatase YjhB (NUDIX family) [Allocatelliglobosispora scoriae]